MESFPFSKSKMFFFPISTVPKRRGWFEREFVCPRCHSITLSFEVRKVSNVLIKSVGFYPPAVPGTVSSYVSTGAWQTQGHGEWRGVREQTARQTPRSPVTLEDASLPQPCCSFKVLWTASVMRLQSPWFPRQLPVDTLNI